MNSAKNRSYNVRRSMGGDGHDVSGRWLAVIVETDDPLPHVLTSRGYQVGDEVLLTSTSNAGFRGIEVSGDSFDDREPFHGVSLGHFEIVSQNHERNIVR